MATFETCVAYVLNHEGGLTDNPSDNGGITNFGISLRFLREVPKDALKRAGIFDAVDADTIRNLTKDQAVKLYFSEFWQKADFEKITNLNSAKYIFDMSVNSGLSRAVKIAQRACCAIARCPTYLKQDGIMGTQTLAAINHAALALASVMIAERCGFFRVLVARDARQSVFLNGWLNRAHNI